MAIIQVVVDDGGQVVAVNRVPVSRSQRAADTAKEVSGAVATYGYNLVEPSEKYTPLIKSSTRLNDEQRAAALRTLLRREVGDPVVEVNVNELPVIPPPAVDQSPTQRKALIIRYIDP